MIMVSGCSHSHCGGFINSSHNIPFTEWRVWKAIGVSIISHFITVSWSAGVRYVSYQYLFHHQ